MATGLPAAMETKPVDAADRNLDLARKLRDGAKMRIGTAIVVNGADGQPNGPVPPPENDRNRDLPRIGTLLAEGVLKENDFPSDLRQSPTFKQRAFIGDPRNDENLVIAQFHLALLRFHNAVVDWLRIQGPTLRERAGGAVRGRAQDRALDLPVAGRQRFPQDALATRCRRDGPPGPGETLPEAP